MNCIIKIINNLFSRSRECKRCNTSDIIKLIQHQQEQINKLMNALDSLQDSVTKLSTTIDQVVTVLNTPHPTEQQVQAAADAVKAQVDRLNVALGNVPTV